MMMMMIVAASACSNLSDVNFDITIRLESLTTRWERGRCQWQPLLRKRTRARKMDRTGICSAWRHRLLLTTMTSTLWSG